MTGAATTGAVLVTGVEGMIGYAVAARLAQSGRPVVGMDRHIRDARDLGIATVVADLSDIHALYGMLTAHEVRSIVHCGAISGPMLAKDDPYGLIQINVTGTLNILEACRRLQLERLVFCSSLMVYGASQSSPLREDAPLRATDAYGASKIAAEALVNAYIAAHGVDAVSARLAWVYGPRRQTPCSIRRMLTDAMAGRSTQFLTGASALRQYVHVEDVASALVALLDAPVLKRRVYNVSGDDFRPFASVADAVRALVPNASISIGDTPDPEDPPMGQLSTEALRQDTAWRPALPLEEGLARYRDWLAQNESPLTP